MKEKLKKIIPLIAITLISLFALIGCPGLTVDLTPTVHNCAYGFESKGLKSGSDVHELVTESSNWTTSATKESPRVYYYHLSKDCNFNKQVTLGDYVYVGICLYKSALTGIEGNVITNSTNGIFVYDCTRHGCYHNQAEAITLSKSIIDFNIALAKIKGETYQIQEGYYGIDGNVDFVGYLNEQLISFANPQKTYVCYNNRGDQANVTRLINLGVKVNVDCVEDKNVYAKVHDCAYEDMLSLLVPTAFPIGQTEVDYILSGGEGVTIPTLSWYYLTEDVSYDGQMALPPEYLSVICLNGYSFSGKYSGNIFLLDCESHVCVDSNNEKHIPLNQEFLELVSCAGKFLQMEEVLLPSGNYALIESVDLTGLNVGFDSVSDYVVCGNGFTVLGDIAITDNVRLQDCTYSADRHTHEGLSPHITAVRLTSSNVRNYFDSNGVLLNKNKEQAFYLGGDIVLEKSLVIPTGATVSLCLNGFSLYSFGVPYENLSTIKVCYNARFKIFDCSEEKTGNIVLKIKPKEEGEKTESESSLNRTGLDFGNMRMSAVCNLGLTELFDGNLYGYNGVYNVGKFLMHGGTINGVLSGIYQDSPDVDDFPLTSSNIQSEISSGEVSGILIGAGVSFGDSTFENCTVNGLFMGIVSGASITGNVDADGNLTIGNVVLNLTTEHAERIASMVNESLISENTSNGSPQNEQYYAIQSSGNITFTGDFVCNIDPVFLESYVTENKVVEPTKIDVAIAQNTSINATEGVEFTDKLTLYVKTSAGDSQIVISQTNVSDLFVPVKDATLVTNSNGGTTILSGDSARFLNNAKVEASVERLETFVPTFTFTYDTESDLDSFLNSDKSSVILIDNETQETVSYEPWNTDIFYAVSEKVYALSLPISPKDYQRSVTVKFAYGDLVWTGVENATIESLLLKVIDEVNEYLSENEAISVDSESEYSEKVALRDYAITTLNYYQNTAVMFGTSNGFENCEEKLSIGFTVSEMMDMVTLNELVDYKKTDINGAPINGVQIAGTSIILNHNIDLRLYIKLSDSIDFNNLKLTVNGVDMDIMPYEGVKNGYYVEVTGIRSYELTNNFTFKFTYGEESYEFSYGVLSYVYTTLKNGKSEDLATINCKAIALYAMFAQIYNDVLNQNAESVEV